jgi:hypothetical protein
MIVKEFYMTRKDGVNLYKSWDVATDKDGLPIKDNEGNYVPTGLMIRKVGTEEVYAEAIDVESAPYVYVETDKPIEVEEDANEQFKQN